jgi:hypothetical protein
VTGMFAFGELLAAPLRELRALLKDLSYRNKHERLDGELYLLQRRAEVEHIVARLSACEIGASDPRPLSPALLADEPAPGYVAG